MPSIRKFPKVVRIEPASACNLRCIHCPTKNQHILNVKKSIMDWGLFCKICGEIKNNIDCVKVAVLYHGGEPLLNKRIWEMASVLKTIGVEKIKMNTNGMFLDYSARMKLIDSGIEEIYVSVDGNSPEENNRIRFGSHYDTIIGNVKQLARVKTMFNLQKPKIVIPNVQFGANKDRPTFLLKDIGNLDIEIKTYRALCWPGMNVDDYNIVFDYTKQGYCDNIENTITIRSDGLVVPCCFDLTNQSVMGNINNSNIIDVWNGLAYNELRKVINIDNKPPGLCRYCPVLGRGTYLEEKRTNDVR